MRTGFLALTLGGSLIALAMTATFYPRPVHSAPADGVSLLQTLAEWKYPDSKMLGGASMSDAGIPPMQAAKCAAVLTTSDPIEKVIAFYAEKLKAADDRPLAIQDDSKDRPLTLRVFVVNRLDTSTTLVISRAEGEKETHIAWSHFIRLGAGQAKAADDQVQFSLGIYSGREDPTWKASEEDVRAFTARFDSLKVRDAVAPLTGVLGYHGFLVQGFRSYDRIWIWRGTVEATREGRTYQWVDEGRALERLLLEASKAHISDQEFKMAAAEVEKK